MNQIQLIGLAHRLADQYVIEVITSNATHDDRVGARWYDTGPMLDERECSGPAIDKAREVLSYAYERGLISAHPTQAGLFRVTRELSA